MMQKAYDIFFSAGCMVAAALVAIACLSSIRPIIDAERLALAFFASFIIFLLASLSFRLSNRGWALRLPRRVKARAFERALAVCLLAAVASLVFGFFAWPHAPLRLADGAYVDKLGHVYTQREYESFRLWEVTYLCLCGVVAIGALLSLPFLSVRERRYRFGGVDSQPGS